MVFKKITTRKTPSGYSITVQVQDGRLVKPLYFGLERFFDEWEKKESGQKGLEVRHIAEEEAADLRRAVVLK